MKRVLALSTAVILIAGSMAGCSGGSGTAATQAAAETQSAETEAQVAESGNLTGELAVMVNNAFTGMEDPAIMRAAKAFEEANPGVTITIEGLGSSDLISKYTTSAMAGSGPDVVALDNSGWPIDLAAMGLIIPLDEQIASSGNDYLQGPLESGLYEGQYYSVPWYFNNTGLYYNKRILSEIGKTEPPTNWEEFEEDIKLATELGYAGVSTRLDGYAIFNIFFENDNPVIDVSGDRPVVTVNEESGKEAFEFWTGLHTKYHAFPEGMKDASDWATAYTTFVSDDCLFFICGDWGYANIASGNPDMEFGLAPMIQGSVQAVCLGGYNLAINSNCTNPELAWAFVDYLTSKECDYVMSEQGRIPGRTDVDYEPILEINPDYQVFIDEAAYTVPRPRVKNAASVDVKMVDAFKKVFFDQMSAEQALNELETELNDFINENY
ncbi:MAG: sugar ABC transporter substrate-binding protein [Clostridiales bacterium]|nr:sugar ABC transporter substrate-binding protein [Clostridiales bacterium]